MIEKAEKTLKKFSLFGSSSKYEDAAELYTNAGNLFKMAKNWQEAGNAFQKTAECHLKLQVQHEAATAYVSAGAAYKKVNPKDAIMSYEQAVEIFTEMGRFSSAAKHQKELAEVYEGEKDLESAIIAYQSAADMYAGEDQTSQANNCLLKVAEFAAETGDFTKAIEVYEEVASRSLDNNLLRWSVKEYFLCAGICQLCTGDMVTASRAIDRYADQDESFANQRECKLLRDVLEACENNDVEAFTNVVYEYDSISKLDSWKTNKLLKVKNDISSRSNDIT